MAVSDEEIKSTRAKLKELLPDLKIESDEQAVTYRDLLEFKNYMHNLSGMLGHDLHDQDKPIPNFEVLNIDLSDPKFISTTQAVILASKEPLKDPTTKGAFIKNIETSIQKIPKDMKDLGLIKDSFAKLKKNLETIEQNGAFDPSFSQSVLSLAKFYSFEGVGNDQDRAYFSTIGNAAFLFEQLPDDIRRTINANLKALPTPEIKPTNERPTTTLAPKASVSDEEIIAYKQLINDELYSGLTGMVHDPFSTKYVFLNVKKGEKNYDKAIDIDSDTFKESNAEFTKYVQERINELRDNVGHAPFIKNMGLQEKLKEDGQWKPADAQAFNTLLEFEEKMKAGSIIAPDSRNAYNRMVSGLKELTPLIKGVYDFNQKFRPVEEIAPAPEKATAKDVFAEASSKPNKNVHLAKLKTYLNEHMDQNELTKKLEINDNLNDKDFIAALNKQLEFTQKNILKDVVSKPVIIKSKKDTDRAFEVLLTAESNGGHQFEADGVTPLESTAGAIGAAQVMPGTAPEAAKLAGVVWNETRYKNDRDYNITIGKAYFRQQLKNYGSDLAKAYAGYHAGPGNTNKAITEAGQDGDWIAVLKNSEGKPALASKKYIAENMSLFTILVQEGQLNKTSLKEVLKKVHGDGPVPIATVKPTNKKEENPDVASTTVIPGGKKAAEVDQQSQDGAGATTETDTPKAKISTDPKKPYPVNRDPRFTPEEERVQKIEILTEAHDYYTLPYDGTVAISDGLTSKLQESVRSFLKNETDITDRKDAFFVDGKVVHMDPARNGATTFTFDISKEPTEHNIATGVMLDELVKNRTDRLIKLKLEFADLMADWQNDEVSSRRRDRIKEIEKAQAQNFGKFGDGKEELLERLRNTKTLDSFYKSTAYKNLTKGKGESEKADILEIMIATSALESDRDLLNTGPKFSALPETGGRTKRQLELGLRHFRITRNAVYVMNGRIPGNSRNYETIHASDSWKDTPIDDRFFEPEEYDKLAFGDRDSRQQLAVRALAKLEAKAAELGIPKDKITQAMFGEYQKDGKTIYFNPHYDDLALAFEGLPMPSDIDPRAHHNGTTAYHRNQAWGKRFGGLTDKQLYRMAQRVVYGFRPWRGVPFEEAMKHVDVQNVIKNLRHTNNSAFAYFRLHNMDHDNTPELSLKRHYGDLRKDYLNMLRELDHLKELEKTIEQEKNKDGESGIKKAFKEKGAETKPENESLTTSEQFKANKELYKSPKGISGEDGITLIGPEKKLDSTPGKTG